MLALAGFGVTAFGVAPLGSGAGLDSQRLVTESVSLAHLDGQVQALEGHDLSLFRSDVTRPGDSVDSLLRRLNVADARASSFLRSNAVARELMAGRGGKMVQVRTGADGELVELVARYPARNPAQANTHFTRLRVTQEGGQFFAHLEAAAMSAQTRYGQWHGAQHPVQRDR